jgi:hypothetical protein
MSFSVKSSCLKSSVVTQLAHFQRHYEAWIAGSLKNAVKIMLKRLQPEEILAAADSLVVLAQSFHAATGWLNETRENHAIDDAGGYRHTLGMVG